jgi:cobalt/nickel transport protein
MRTTLALSLPLLLAGSAAAHFNMLLPNRASARKGGEEVLFTYEWGHPFEHELFDAPAPEAVTALGPDGKTVDLTKSLEKTTAPAGDRKVTTYLFRFTPEQRGDYVFLLRTPPIWMDDEQEYWQDDVKVVLHVEAQRGWDGELAGGLDLAPLTRPYGLEPGMAFQAVLQAGGRPPKPLAGVPVEIERYNAEPPKHPPPDEHRTRVSKTDPNGVVTATLTDPGWWCLAAAQEAGQKEHDGKARPLRRRAIFWVYVDEKGGK